MAFHAHELDGFPIASSVRTAWDIDRIREAHHTFIEPDVLMDFRQLPVADGAFRLVVFDPPHLARAGVDSWMRAKYGMLTSDWREDIRQGFAGCFRVLEPEGILIFKWNETQVLVSELLALTNEKPLFGHKSGKREKTHWIPFMKR